MIRKRVLAPALTRANIMNAIRSMRMYSSDDWNAKVDFTIASQPMGSIMTHAYAPVITVHITDLDAEATASIKVYGGVPGGGMAPTLIASNVNSNTLTCTAALANKSTSYYYLQIAQADGDMMYTSPIWYTRNDDAATPISSNTFHATSAAFNVYPNPSTGLITVELEKMTMEGFDVEIINELGQLVYKKSITNNYSATIDLHAQKGFYTIKVRSGDGITVKKLIVE